MIIAIGANKDTLCRVCGTHLTVDHWLGEAMER